MLIQKQKCACLLWWMAILWWVLLASTPAESISDSEFISRLTGADDSAESATSEGAIAEIERIYGVRFGVTSEGSLTGYYVPDRYISRFFFNHNFYWFIISWNEKPEQYYFIAVNRKTLAPYLLLGEPVGKERNEKRILNVSSNAFFVHELSLENLNTVISNDSISINDNNIKAYVQEVFEIIGIRCYGGLYMHQDFIIYSLENIIKQDKTGSNGSDV